MHLSPDSIGKQVPQLSPRPNSKQQRSLRDCCDPGLLRIPAYLLSLKKQKGGNQRKRKGSGRIPKKSDFLERNIENDLFRQIQEQRRAKAQR